MPFKTSFHVVITLQHIKYHLLTGSFFISDTHFGEESHVYYADHAVVVPDLATSGTLKKIDPSIAFVTTMTIEIEFHPLE